MTREENTLPVLISRAPNGEGGKPYGISFTDETQQALEHIQWANRRVHHEKHRGTWQNVVRLDAFSLIIRELAVKEAKRLGWKQGK